MIYTIATFVLTNVAATRRTKVSLVSSHTNRSFVVTSPYFFGLITSCYCDDADCLLVTKRVVTMIGFFSPAAAMRFFSSNIAEGTSLGDMSTRETIINME